MNMTKQRLTITLSASTLNKIDNLIDGKKIRSRSHAIETLLQQSLQPQVKLAVILAGDKNPQAEIKKPLTKINQEPLIIHTLKLLAQHGVEKVIILTNKKGKILETVIEKNNLNKQLQIKFIFEEKSLGTAGALKNATKYLTEPFYCLHADILTNIDLQQMAQFHEKEQPVATIAVKPRMTQDSYDNVYLQGNQVVDFQPKKDNQTVSIVNTGVYLFTPEILNYIPDQKVSLLEKDVFPQLAANNKLCAYTFQGMWFDVGSDQNYKQAIKNLY